MHAAYADHELKEIEQKTPIKKIILLTIKAGKNHIFKVSTFFTYCQTHSIHHWEKGKLGRGVFSFSPCSYWCTTQRTEVKMLQMVSEKNILYTDTLILM